jgi:hypothetical protein
MVTRIRLAVEIGAAEITARVELIDSHLLFLSVRLVLMASQAHLRTGDTLLVLVLSPLYRDCGMDYAVDSDGAHELHESGIVDSGRRRGRCTVRLRNDSFAVRRNERGVSPLDIGAFGLTLQCPVHIDGADSRQPSRLVLIQSDGASHAGNEISSYEGADDRAGMIVREVAS